MQSSVVVVVAREAKSSVGSASWPCGHIPIDTSLCCQSPQVRIYGFVAAGISRWNQVEEAVNLKENKVEKIKKLLFNVATLTGSRMPSIFL